ncbi:ribosome biogenesis GTPase YlqF [Anaerolentibacter hominis]|uniref:ribosome biogenesis GTPase YlqF n=1 Tax=Anaerolentibacter hominis TaxID=3079009 RepID=UPI0031B820B3
MQFQWYPGHMTKAKRMMQEDIKLIDLVIELVDARIPLSSKNPDIDELAKNKARLILLNKTDLADEAANRLWQEWYAKQGFYTAQVNSRSGSGIRALPGVITQACQPVIEKYQRKGLKNRPIRAMIVGIPNVGKSTFINSFAGKACAKTGNKPGVTKGKQWIRFGKNVELLDTPGILWPKFEDQNVGLKLAFIGSIRDEIVNQTDLAYEFIKFMQAQYPDKLYERYPVEPSDNPLTVMERIAEYRKCVARGNTPDLDRAALLIMDDFRKGATGRITLELP